MSIRELTTDQRLIFPRHHIDIGFINPRLIFSTLGIRFHEEFEKVRKPGVDHWTRLFNDHLLTSRLLGACGFMHVQTLSEVLHAPRLGQLFCSTEEFSPCPEIYSEADRVTSILKLPYESDWIVNVNYDKKKIVADTGRMVLADGGYKETIVAGIHSIRGNTIITHPLVIGAPTFDHPLNRDLQIDLTWYGQDWYEVFPEDFREFHRMMDTPVPEPNEWMPVMEKLSEPDVKGYLSEILGDITKKDWGGEINDHYSSSTHLGDERVTSAFLLKGPARFEEMQPKHLGKNADQIFRLSQSPSDVLVVQHCHNIGEAVRATLRAFAVNPSSPRRYCLIDGKDTYRLLKAYGKIPA